MYVDSQRKVLLKDIFLLLLLIYLFIYLFFEKVVVVLLIAEKNCFLFFSSYVHTNYLGSYII